MAFYNFGPAASDEELVYGARRPGYPSTNPTETEVKSWLNHMEDHNIQRVCCLLEEKLHLYDDLLNQYEERFGSENVLSAPIVDRKFVGRETFHHQILPFLTESVREDQRVVVHCSAGSGRTGHILALWLAHERDYTLPEAIEGVISVENINRNPLEAAMGDEDADLSDRL